MLWGSWHPSSPLPGEQSFLRWCWCYRVKPPHRKLKITSDHAPLTFTKLTASALMWGQALLRKQTYTAAEEIHSSSPSNLLNCPVVNTDSLGSPDTEEKTNTKRRAKMVKNQKIDSARNRDNPEREKLLKIFISILKEIKKIMYPLK